MQLARLIKHGQTTIMNLFTIPFDGDALCEEA